MIPLLRIFERASWNAARKPVCNITAVDTTTVDIVDGFSGYRCWSKRKTSKRWYSCHYTSSVHLQLLHWLLLDYSGLHFHCRLQSTVAIVPIEDTRNGRKLGHYRHQWHWDPWTEIANSISEMFALSFSCLVCWYIVYFKLMPYSIVEY